MLICEVKQCQFSWARCGLELFPHKVMGVSAGGPNIAAVVVPQSHWFDFTAGRLFPCLRSELCCRLRFASVLAPG